MVRPPSLGLARSSGRGRDSMFDFRSGWAQRFTNDGGPLVFVWSLWLLHTWWQYLMIAEYGLDIPYMDEWEMVLELTGHQPLTLTWIWSLHNEHRLVMGRLLYLAANWLGGGSFRSGMFVD